MKDLAKIMQQAQQMQAKMQEAQEKIEATEADGVAGAGLVKVRLKGKGVAPAKGVAGDQYVRLKIVLPARIDADMEAIAQRWRDRVSEDPRAALWRAM